MFGVRVEESTEVQAQGYGSLVGALQYVVEGRPDVAYPVGVGGRCRTFPTRGMATCMLRVLVYLGRTSHLANHYTGKAEGDVVQPGVGQSCHFYQSRAYNAPTATRVRTVPPASVPVVQALGARG